MLFISSKNIFERLTPFVKSILNHLNISFNDSIEHVKKKKLKKYLLCLLQICISKQPPKLAGFKVAAYTTDLLHIFQPHSVRVYKDNICEFSHSMQRSQWSPLKAYFDGINLDIYDGSKQGPKQWEYVSVDHQYK